MSYTGILGDFVSIRQEEDLQHFQLKVENKHLLQH